MTINETLARGLKDRFFEDFPAEITGPFHKELRSMSLRSVKRGKWVKAARACVDRLERFFDRFIRGRIQGEAVFRNERSRNPGQS